jgi:hypothetical protein
LILLALVALASGCAGIKRDRTLTTWFPDGHISQVHELDSYDRFGGQTSLDGSLTSDTLRIIVNPHPETTADIINAAANAALSGAKKATTGAVKP